VSNGSESDPGSLTVRTAEDLGQAVRRRRLSAGFTQEHASGLAGVGTRFLGELERGKPTVQLGRALKVLQMLGLELRLVPRERASRHAAR